ncbi:MAG: hypothetical protein ACYCY0_09645 [Acidithiobacillus ferrivorans]
MTTPLTGAYGFVRHHVQAATPRPLSPEVDPRGKLRHQAHGILNRREALQAAGFQGCLPFVGIGDSSMNGFPSAPPARSGKTQYAPSRQKTTFTVRSRISANNQVP